MAFTVAYLMADRESATTESPAMPVANHAQVTFWIVQRHLRCFS